MTTDKTPATLADGWPEHLMIRDTGLADDMGGLGQRIFTTAGAGYMKKKYIREDLAHPATLATVKHGGCVQLGDGWSGWATQYPGKMPKLCGARELAELNHYPEEGQRLIFLSEQPVQAGALVDAARAAIPFVAYAFSEGVTGAEEAGRAIEAALSAQPSPGGQDAPRCFVSLDMLAGSKHKFGEAFDHPQGSFVRYEDHVRALAARQPVGTTEQPYNSGGIELTACQLHEALLMAGSPELDVPFEDRSLVRIFWTETGHSGPGLYCECVGAEEEGCILLDGTAPAIGQPAQAVDLDK